jgi:hypothetical protein
VSTRLANEQKYIDIAEFHSGQTSGADFDATLAEAKKLTGPALYDAHAEDDMQFKAGAGPTDLDGGDEPEPEPQPEVKTYPNGVRYEGQVEDGLPHGQGKMTDPDGTYEGQFQDGKPHGQSKYIYPDGGSYEGHFKDGQAHGQVKLTDPDGGSYEGPVKDDKPHGRGKIIYSDRSYDTRMVKFLIKPAAVAPSPKRRPPRKLAALLSRQSATTT